MIDARFGSSAPSGNVAHPLEQVGPVQRASRRTVRPALGSAYWTFLADQAKRYGRVTPGHGCYMAAADFDPGKVGPIRSTHLPPRPESVPAARHFASDAASEMGAKRSVVDTELLVSELATNAVLHARTPMRVSVLLHGERVRVEVRDDDPTLPQQRPLDPLSPGGRGIVLVELLARAWGINHNERGKTVWFELEEPTD